jgi:hypothetical protein
MDLFEMTETLQTKIDRSPSSIPRIQRTALFILAILLLFSLATLGRVPAIPHADDGAYGAAAHQFWQTGRPGIPGCRLLDLDRDVIVLGRTAAAIQGFPMWLSGVSLFAAMLPSFLAGIGVLGLTYFLGRSLWDSRTALLAVVILAASGIFFSATHLTRPDILLTLIFLGSLYGIVSAPVGKVSWHHGAAGLLMGVGGDVHLNSFILSPVPLIFAFLLRREALRTRMHIGLWYAGGLILGALFWIALHYIPNRDIFAGQLRIVGGQTHGLRVMNLGFFGAIHAEIQRYLAWFWDARLHRHLPEGLIILGCGIGLLIRGTRKERSLLALWALVFSLAALFMANPFGWYLIYVWPLFALWIARAFGMAYVPSAISPLRRWGPIALLVILFITYGSNLTLWTWKSFQCPSYASISGALRETIPPGGKVIAGGEWWFALRDRDFTDMLSLELTTRIHRREGLGLVGWGQQWQQARWQYIVGFMDTWAMLDSRVPVAQAIASIRLGEVQEILEARSFAVRQCRRVREFSTPNTPIIVFQVFPDTRQPSAIMPQ